MFLSNNNGNAGEKAETITTRREIRKIMEEDAAKTILDTIKNKICKVDLDEICGDNIKITEGQNSVLYRRLVQAVQCGLVDWDDEENCMVQTLIHPVKTGSITCDKLYYKTNITLGDAKDFKTTNQAEVIIKSIATMTGKGIQVIEKLRGQDLDIATGCMYFFDR